jgi:signal transduction histidine kinase
MGIQQKIIIPFALLIIAAVGITGALAVRLSTARTLRRAKEEENFSRMRDEMKRVKEILSLDIPVSKPLLERIKPLFEGQIVLTDAGNRATLSTLDGAEMERIRPILRASGGAGGAPSIAREAVGVKEYFVVADRLPKTGGNAYLMFEAEKVGSAPEAPVTAVIIIAAGALAAVLGLGVWIARTITRPIEELARRAGEIRGGELDRPVDVKGGGEIGALAGAFNGMLAGIRAYQERLVESEKMAALGQIAAGIAHEIRNPLNSISMNVQVMEKEGQLDGESIRIIMNEVERLKIVIEELLDFARSPAGEAGPCDVNGIAGEVLGLMERQLAHCGITVEKDCGARGRALAEANRLKQVMMNLLINAMQAMPSGGKIWVRTEDRKWEGGGDAVRCSVRDSGKGVPEALREKIFQPFFTTREGGSGLGLAICRRIIEEYGGKMDFESDETGSAFWFELPGREA